MKVKELIAALQQCDQESSVFVNHDGEYCAEVKLEDPANELFTVVSQWQGTEEVILLTLGPSNWTLPVEDEDEDD